MVFGTALLSLATQTAIAQSAPSAYLFGGGTNDGVGGQQLALVLADGSTLVANTASRPLSTMPGKENFGWWSDAFSRAPGNDNYLSGFVNVWPATFRNFFSFDLSNLNGSVVGATLLLNAYSASWPTTKLLYELYDVSTDPYVLQNKSGLDPVIFQDLGSGRSYGSIEVFDPQYESPTLKIALNAYAIEDINSHQGNYFTLGGVTTPIPEPSTAGLALGGIVLLALRRSRQS